MNFMRQAQVSAMVRNASGQREWRDFGDAKDVSVEIDTLTECMSVGTKIDPATLAGSCTFTCAASPGAEEREVDPFTQRMIDAAVQRQITRTCARPPVAGLTTEAPTGRYQGLGFRDGA